MADHVLPSNTSASEVVPKKRKWVTRLFVLCLLMLSSLAGLAWFGPSIVAATALKQQVPKLLFPSFPGSVELGETSLGWLSPVVIRNLKATDDQGKPLLEVREFSTGEKLWTLATRTNDIGRLKLVEPVVHVALRNDGSNVEDVVTKYLNGLTGTGPAADVQVEVEYAKVELDHKQANRQATIEPLSLRVVSIKGTLDELDLVAGKLPKDKSEASDAEWFAVRFGGVDKNADESKKKSTDTKPLLIRASNWKLERFAAALCRVQPNAELAGVLDADCRGSVSLSAEPLEWEWSGRVALSQLLLAGLNGMKRDRLVLDEVALSGRAASSNGRLLMNELQVSTGVGELTATGDIPIASWTGKSSADIVRSLLSEEDYRIAGHVDLKKLAAKLPQTMRVREGTEITGGKVAIEFVGADIEKQRRWTGHVTLAGLSAINDGRRLSWESPLETRFRAHEDQSEIIVDEIVCSSDFLQLKGSGTLEDAKFQAAGDLTKLQDNIERFIDLGHEQLAGRMQATGAIRRDDDGRIQLASDITLDDFAYVVSKETEWREQHLVLNIAAVGQAQKGQTQKLTSIDSAKLRLNSAGDVLELTLQQPVDLTAKEPTYATSAKLNGLLTTWQNRLRPIVDVADWRLAGTIDLTADVTSGLTQIDVTRANATLSELTVRGPEWLIQEPQAKLATSGVWDGVKQTWTLPRSTLVGNAVACEVDNLVCVLGKSGLAKLAGDAKYRADLKQVSKWKNQALAVPSYFVGGTLSGLATVTEQAEVLSANLNAQVDQFEMFQLQTATGQKPKWEPLWSEPQLKLSGKGAYESNADKLIVEGTSLVVDGLSATAKGQLEQCTTKQRVDLSGEFVYDWDALAKRFSESFRKNVQLTGKDRRPFSLRGTLASASLSSTVSETNTSDLSGQAGIGWASAIAYGMNFGAADISLRIDKGVGRLNPIDMAVNEGKLHLEPQFRFDVTPSLLVLPKEKVLDQVRLSPELCNQWLKFVAPLLADATQVEGRFSLDVASGSLPLAAMTTGDVDGSLAVHDAQVRPGSLAAEIVGTVEQIRSIVQRRPPKPLNRERPFMKMPAQDIPFRLTEGRVAHQGATFAFSDLVVRTSGSVGLDESLDLIADIPIKDEWVGSNEKLLGSLRGKTVQIPIRGTLSRPQLDNRVLARLARDVGTSAVGSLLEDQLKGKVPDKVDDVIKQGLDQLFSPKKKK